MKYLDNFLARFYFVQFIYMNFIEPMGPEAYLETLKEVFIIDELNEHLFQQLTTAYYKYHKEMTDKIDSVAQKPITDSILKSCLIAGCIELKINNEKKLVISEYIKIGKDFDVNIGMLNRILDEINAIINPIELEKDKINYQ